MADTIEVSPEWVGDIPALPAILDAACEATGMGFAAIARVTPDRWVACAVRDDSGFGLAAGGELPIRTTLCDEIRNHRQPVVIPDVACDPVYADHHVPQIYKLRSYISVPIVLEDGQFFGTLCAIDADPRPVGDKRTLRLFTLLAELIGLNIDARLRLAATTEHLEAERRVATLRDQFIGILGHDLRNPLASINSGVRLLSRGQLDARGREVLVLIQGSIQRMTGLIDNVVDYARTALGDGIGPLQTEPVDAASLIMQIVAELQATHPGRSITIGIEAAGQIMADRIRLGQVFSNLLDNALLHGEAGGPVEAFLRTVPNEPATDGHGTSLVLEVRNRAPRLDDALVERLFKPFARAQSEGRKGLGLGLSIASEIATAHGGTLSLHQGDDGWITFRLVLPGQPA